MYIQSPTKVMSDVLQIGPPKSWSRIVRNNICQYMLSTSVLTEEIRRGAIMIFVEDFNIKRERCL